MKSKITSKIKGKHQKEVLSILEKIGAIITEDHFVYVSGKHGSVYVRKDKLYPDTKLTSKITSFIAEDLKKVPIDVVVGPSVGGILLSSWTAHHLSRIKKKNVLSFFTEKSYGDDKVKDGEQVFKRGYDKLLKGKKVLVVEDMTTTGGSVKKVVEEVKKAGGKVVSIYVMLNRNPKEVNERIMGSNFRSLSELQTEIYIEKECPLCKERRPINIEVGHGKEYLQRKKN